MSNKDASYIVRPYRDPSRKITVLDIYEFDEELKAWVSDCRVQNGTVRFIDGELRYSKKEQFELGEPTYDISRCEETQRIYRTAWYPCASAE